MKYVYPRASLRFPARAQQRKRSATKSIGTIGYWLTTSSARSTLADRRRHAPMRGICRLLALACLGLSLGACSALPDYARPVTLSADQLRMKDVIRYRPLERSDFKGEQPPPGFDLRMGAAICAFFKNNIDAESFEFTYLGLDNYRHVYSVKFKKPRVWALMDRECSWWNPGIDESDQAYVLQHEEVHFALFEIAARKWTEQLESTEFRISGGDESELKQDLQAQFDEFWESGKHELDSRNLEFDERTSAVFDPEGQREYLAMVRAELSSGVAAGISSPAPDCTPDAQTREALTRARRAIEAAAAASEGVSEQGKTRDLIEQARAALGPPACDPVRAGMLADEANRLAEQ